jgi:hypothetical protein
MALNKENNMIEFIPTEYDKAWMKRLFGLIANGGIWGTSWAVYKKIDTTTMSVTSRNDVLYKPEVVDENIMRVKTVCEAIGIKFVDLPKEQSDKSIN